MADPTNRQWYQFSVEATAKEEGVDPVHGLDDSAVQQRLAQFGPNKLAEKPKEPRWKAFLRQYRDLMQIILLATGLISLIFLRDVDTFLLLFILTVFNAVLGMSQEKKAEASLASLRGMMQLQARVRRNGQVAQVAADDLVPGDVVLFEAGDLVPADGRLIEAATLEIEEAALTGESTPTLKDLATIDKADVALGDQHNMAFMNTTVTRGRGAMIVTATGMQTQMGAIAGMMQAVKEEKTPLQKQLDQLTVIMAIMAGVAFLVMSAIGLMRGQPFNLLLITGVSMAIAAIPTGLPAVVTTVLALGTTQLAKANAIVKRLTSVETLGSTSAICSDKTGTLTLNQMTVRELVVVGNRYVVDGEGYSTQGTIKPVGEDPGLDLRPAYIAMALDTDAALDGAKLIGDPTEGALIVLAEKGGVPVAATREEYPPRRRGALRLRVQVDGHLPPHDESRRQAGHSRLCQRCARRTAGALDARDRAKRHADSNRRHGACRRERAERAAGVAGHARAGLRRQGLRPRHLRPQRQPARRDARAGALCHGRHRRPAAAGGQGRHRRGT